MTLEMLFRKLHDERIVGSADPPAPVTAGASSPWHIKVLLGLSGFIAGTFVAGFFGTLLPSVLRTGVAGLVVGVALCATAAILYRRLTGELGLQFALAVSMAGQAFVAMGISAIVMRNGAVGALLFALFQALLVIAMRNYLHRLISTVLAVVALYYALYRWHLAGVGGILVALAFAEIWLRESRWRASIGAEAMSAVSLGLAFALLLWAVPTHVRALFPVARVDALPEAAGYALALVIFAARACDDASTRARIASVAGAALLAALAWKMPGVIACALLMAAGFRARHRLMMAMAAVGFVGYLSAYYYFLQETLLAKSQSLAITGAAFVAAGVALHFVSRGNRDA